VALAAGENIKLLKKQIETFHPKLVAVGSKDNALKLSEALTAKSRLRYFTVKKA